MRKVYASGPYPIDFMPTTSEVMHDIFSLVGFGVLTEAEQNRSSRLRKMLLEQGGLLTLRRPSKKPKPVIYYHANYTEAAFQAFRGAPVVDNFPTRQAWLSAMGFHLEDFAEEPPARELIGEAVTTYYNRIADAATLIPGRGNKPWIGIHREEGKLCPLDYVGVNYPDVDIAPANVHIDWKNSHGRKYYSLQPVARQIGWNIPGITDPETRTAIVEQFEATREADWVVDPQQLFMCGSVAIQGVERPVSDIFEQTL